MKHIKVFGSICYKHIPDARKSMLDDKNEKMIRIGCHSTGTYKLYDPKSQKIHIGREVLVNESWN